MKSLPRPALLFLVLLGLVACRQEAPSPAPQRPELVEVARSDRQWTGVAVSRQGRVFVTFPRWSDAVPVSVGELAPDGTVRPYPDGEWNRWDPTLAPGDHFVCAQSVFVDAEDFLWILDPASPKFQGVVEGGAKLLRVDLRTDRVEQKILFDAETAPPASYLNDVRVDTGRRLAYLSDSGTGALVVVDLAAGTARRHLADHPSTKSMGIAVTIGGQRWLRPDGSRPEVHVDGIALDRSGEYLYYQALTGRSLFRIPTRLLAAADLEERERGAGVEFVARTGPVDGILFGPDGHLYLTALEEHAVRRYTPQGRLETVVRDQRLRWPDSLAATADGTLYVTTSQIHFGDRPPGPYLLLRVRPAS